MMKKIIFILTLTLGLVSCGKDNSSGGNSNNGIDSTQRYTLLAEPANTQNVRLMHDDDLEIFRLELLNDRTFTLLGFNVRGNYKVLLKSTWFVSGTQIVLNDLGAGTYIDSTFNGVQRDCISINPATFSATVRMELRKYNEPENRNIRFCKNR